MTITRSQPAIRATGLRKSFGGKVVLDGIDLADAAIEAFLARGDGGDGDPELLPSGSLQSYRGAIAAVGDHETAFGHRDALVEFVAVAGWTDPAQDQARMAAARRYGAAVEPFASGVYVNDLTDEGQAGIRRAYGPSVLARLAALKDRYDPGNVFHLNHNIRPWSAVRRARGLGAQPTLPGRRNP
jgi:Berberine and berberine like